jgi:ABC-2 type transport system permease protein
VQNYAAGIIQTWQQQQTYENGLVAYKPPIVLEPRFWYNPELKSCNFLVPGSIAIIMTLIGTLLTALVIAREWERGTMEAMLTTPVTVPQMLLGKLIPYFGLGLCSVVICWLVAVLWYEVPFRGSFLVLILTSSAFLLAALGQGLLISSLSRDQFLAAQISIMSAFLPAFMLSGFIFEISSMPKPIQYITYLVPARYLITNLQTLFLVGNIWSLLIKNVLCILAIGSVFFSITLARTTKRLD